ncbi:MAG: DUF370 domain-containing protein [Oscillospiraceae bacterium]|nr:DUF370 domain-containing protein [Oscillospiraceae bacterium]
MYIHLGEKTVVKTKSIIGIFDIDYCSVSRRTRDYLKKNEQAGRVVNVTGELPKSFIVYDDALTGEKAVYISGISTATLRKRASYVDELRTGE